MNNYDLTVAPNAMKLFSHLQVNWEKSEDRAQQAHYGSEESGYIQAKVQGNVDVAEGDQYGCCKSECCRANHLQYMNLSSRLYNTFL